MKNVLILFAVLFFASCSADEKQDIDPTLKVKPETSEKIKEAQDVNIELEAIDGELDSLIISIK